ncbi:MAG TPA: hypothetical protein VGJ44_04605 [Kribbellaceae bacterium]|jgi:hypothetical protein
MSDKRKRRYFDPADLGEIIARPAIVPPAKMIELERLQREHHPRLYAEMADLREIYHAAHAPDFGEGEIDESSIRRAVAVARSNGRNWVTIATFLGADSPREAKARYR